MGILYVIATPIGNLEDLSDRARRMLSEVNLIAAEDTRHTGAMLKRLGIKNRLISYHNFNEVSRVDQLLRELDTGSVALVTDSGTPAISDPGAVLVRAAAMHGFQIVPIPGPSAVTAAISISGLVDGPFSFLGFVPRKKGERRKLLEPALVSGLPLVLYESPHRVVNTLAEIETISPGRMATVGRELTKLHEETLRGTVSQLIALISDSKPKGEFVIVIGGAQPTDRKPDVRSALTQLMKAGTSSSIAAKVAAELSGLGRSQTYALALEIAKGLDPKSIDQEA